MKQAKKSWFVSQVNVFDRIDPLFYRPEIVNLRKKIKEQNGCLIKEVGKVKGGYAFKSSSFNINGSSVPVVKIGEIGEGFVDLSKASLVSSDFLDKYKAYKGKKGLSVVALTGATIGKSGIITEHDLPCLINQRVGIVQGTRINNYYMAAFLNSSASKIQIETLGSGAAQANLSTEQVEAVFIPSPDKDVQDYIGKKVELAERCREVSHGLWLRAMEVLSSFIGFHITENAFVPKNTEELNSHKYKALSINPAISLIDSSRIDNYSSGQMT